MSAAKTAMANMKATVALGTSMVSTIPLFRLLRKYPAVPITATLKH